MMKCSYPFLLASTLALGQAVVGQNLRAARNYASSRSLQDSDIVDFAQYNVGEGIALLDYGITVTAQKRQYKNGPFVDATAMIFDSENPTEADKDLGTPNRDFGGPGVGQEGRKGEPLENSEPQGNVLIISQDDDATTPNDHRFGGYILFEFERPMILREIGLLDNEEDTEFDIGQNDGDGQYMLSNQGGNNSFEAVSLGDVVASQLKVTFGGSGAITYLKVAPFTESPTAAPVPPTDPPTTAPTAAPVEPTEPPTTSAPTASPVAPTDPPTASPTTNPVAPTDLPTTSPVAPTDLPTTVPTAAPIVPTEPPTTLPTPSPVAPTEAPTSSPAVAPVAPTDPPTTSPTSSPVAPTDLPTTSPKAAPIVPTGPPTASPTASPVVDPTESPTSSPTAAPVTPTNPPTNSPIPFPTLCEITSIVVWDETNSEELDTITDNSDVCLEHLDTAGVTIRAVTEDCVEEVEFDLQGPEFLTVTSIASEFTLGDTPSTIGQYTLSAVPNGETVLTVAVVFNLAHCNPVRV